jgi:hypothetical protein
MFSPIHSLYYLLYYIYSNYTGKGKYLMSENNKTSIEILTIIPRNQFVFKYSFNHGLLHTIKKWDAFSYFKTFVEPNNYGLLLDLLTRFRPMLIIPKENQIIELTKNLNGTEYYKKTLKNEIKSVAKNGAIEQKKEPIPNDKEVAKNEKKFFKKLT